MPSEEPPPDEISAQSAVVGDEWDGPWGSIAPVPQSVETLCVQIEHEIGKPRVYYYPYRTIGKWNWRMGVPEMLEIQVGDVLLSVSGTGLRRLAEALNTGNLRLVQFNQPPDRTGTICIRAVFIEDLKS